jgi:hypothetical protein
MNNAQDDIVIQ